MLIECAANGRREPYTETGLRRMACFSCGLRSAHAQWSICALGNRHFPICAECDVELNAIVLRWAGVPGVREIILRYAAAL